MFHLYKNYSAWFCQGLEFLNIPSNFNKLNGAQNSEHDIFGKEYESDNDGKAYLLVTLGAVVSKHICYW
jgi:hypothetical protein